MADALKALVNIISTETNHLLLVYAAQNTEFLSLNATSGPITCSNPGPALDLDPALIRSRQLIVAAATQLIATVRPPAEFLQDAVSAMLKPAALRVIIDTNIPEVLSEEGPQGLHVNDLSVRTGVDESYLARVMRYLATRHIFRELTPNVFTHNRISTLLSKNKSVKDLKADPIGKWDNSPFTSTRTDEIFTSSVHFSAYLREPDQSLAPFNMGHNTSKKLWEWYEEQGNEWRLRRFTAAMKANGNMYPPHIFTSVFDEEALRPGDVVVDVGGNVGTVTLVLKKAFPKLRYVVQDLEKLMPAGEQYWNENDPEASNSGQVVLQAHNFFDQQPVKHAAVYFLRLILHDWPDNDAREILLNLRDAAAPSSKLVIFESLARYTCDDPSLDLSASAPFPLLANLGEAGEGFGTALDLVMLTLFNGKERTLDDFVRLGKESGWKLERMKPGILSALIFTPADSAS
ncbi:S-adenosyl-L-methionine-dependent methyltransferase [Rhodocollybia butyracea]|uniref:S-adenosyl-L-methionine-dependent methyltransferase n=1 Tax=Rhodocollybia butyracea TaxID=206335 RepID=A0A9P5UAM3_9AGAR|nr:S-adenosyl-L-methionine-dependent methyltransferase [Rhodocollybia butyracea]